MSYIEEYEKYMPSEYKDNKDFAVKLFTETNYIGQPKYKILDWIDTSKLEDDFFKFNPHEAAIKYAINFDGIDSFLCDVYNGHVRTKDIKYQDFLIYKTSSVSKYNHQNTDEKFVDFALKNIGGKKINLEFLAENTHDKIAEYFMRNYFIKNYNINNFVVFGALNKNPNDKIVDFLLEDHTRVSMPFFCQNENTRAVRYLISHPEKIQIDMFCRNKNNEAVLYCIKNIRKVTNLQNFLLNENDIAVDFFLQNPQYISDFYFLQNHNKKVVDYYKNNQEKIIWYIFNTNPHIFTLDYDTMKRSHLDFKKELVQKVMHPNRLAKIIKLEKDRLLSLGFTEDVADKMIDIETLI